MTNINISRKLRIAIAGLGFGKKIHLELYVKVSKNWRSSKQQLKKFGYNN